MTSPLPVQPTILRVVPPVPCGHVWSLLTHVERDSRPGDPGYRVCVLCGSRAVEPAAEAVR